MPLPALIAIGFAAGAAVAPALSFPAAALLAAAAALAALLVWLVVSRQGPRVVVLLLCAACAGAGARSGQRAEQLRIIQSLERQLDPQLYTGVVIADEGRVLERRRLTLAVDLPLVPRALISTRVQLSLRDLASTWPRFEPGERVRFRARLRPPPPAWMPGQFDLRALWLGRGLVARASVDGAEDLVRLPPAAGMVSPATTIKRLRQRLTARVERALPAEAAALTRAMVLGDRADVDLELRRDFDGAGAGHLLAVSGLHVGAVTALIFFLVSALARRWDALARRLAPRRLAALCAAPAAIGFALLAGASPSALRAGVMALAVLAGVALWRERATISALGLAALVLLGASPAAIDDPSFVLSFSAVIALLYATPRLRAWLVPNDAQETSGWRARVTAVVCAALATGLVSLPLAALYFGRVAPYGVLANAVVVPIAGLALPLAIGATLLGATLMGVNALTALGESLVQAGGALVLALRDLCAVFASWPGALLDVSPPRPSAVVLILAGLALLVAARRRRRRLLLGGALTALGLTLTLVPAIERSSRLRVAFLPVGQGDATLVRTPDGASMLIDTPGDPRGVLDPGAEVVLPYLRARGLDHLDVVVVTHPDLDHYGGLATVLAEICAREIWWTGQPDENPAWAALEAAVARCGSAQRHFSIDAARASLGGVEFEVLHPLVEQGEATRYWSELSKNDNSVVLLLRHGAHHILLPGDAGDLVETSLIDAGRIAPVDVLKCAHHGSSHSTSPALLRALRPAHAIISAGYANSFGHPSPAVLSRLTEVDAQVWRTDRHGLIELESDGETLIIHGFVDPGRAAPP